MECLTHRLELFPDCLVTLILFNGVKNAAILRRKAMEGAIDGALINPSMVSNLFPLYVFSKVQNSVGRILSVKKIKISE